MLFDDKTWIVMLEKGKKHDLDALANISKIILDMNKHEYDTRNSRFLAYQAATISVLGILWASFFTLDVAIEIKLAPLVILFIMEILLISSYKGSLEKVHKAMDIAMEGYAGIMAKKAGVRLYLIEGGQIEDQIDLLIKTAKKSGINLLSTRKAV